MNFDLPKNAARSGRVLSLSFLMAMGGLGTVLANTAVEPEPRDAKWLARHQGFVEQAKKGGIDVLFLGDSITDFWLSTNPEKGGKAVWDKNFSELRAADFGISADRTQHVLWRMANGELEGIQPKVVVLLIGTNNTGVEKGTTTPRNTTEEAIEGVKAVVSGLRTRLPESKILLLGIFPRGDKNDPIRAQVKQINEALAPLGDGKMVRFLDIGSKFLDADGTLLPGVMPDKLHPSEKGYEIWAEAIKQPLKEMLGQDVSH